MKIIQMIFCLFFIIYLTKSARLCVWQTNNKPQIHHEQPISKNIFEPPTPYIIKASQQIRKQIYLSAIQYVNKNEKFRSYHPHYLHSYSYPQPMTPHLYIGQVLPNNHPIFFMKQNKTLQYSGISDNVNEIFYINNKKQYQYPKTNFQKSKKETHKFIMVLQNENMLEIDIPMQIIVYNFDDYLGIISNLGYGQYKAFILYIQKKGQQAISLNNLPNQIKMNFRNQTASNARQAWMNAQRIRWTGRNRIKIADQFLKPLVLDTLVLEIQMMTPQDLDKYKVFFNQFIRYTDQSVESITQRMKNIHINDKKYLLEIDEKNLQSPTCASQAQNQLYQGITYQYGKVLMKNGSKYINNQPKQLLSFCPSRQRFPWGFLWDDGFHCQVAIRNQEQPEMALKVIKSWLNTVTDFGWIPRQQNRGEERDNLCNCPNFMAKDVRDGNPPTLVLPLHFLSKHRILNTENFELKYYQKLKKWYNWFLDTQQISKGTYVFKWHDSINNQGSFNSGMDDFPRLRNTHGHVDCQAWMYMFSQAMADISFSLEQDGSPYIQMAYKIKKAFEENFIDPKTKLPLDFQIQYGTKKYSQYFGYPSLIPVAFGLIDQQSPQFKQLMKQVKLQLDTSQGIASLSMKSRRYLENNAYWKGPVWININYLFLKGLYEHYLSQNQYYRKLRTQLIRLVCGNLDQSGYFYENYTHGKGTFAHPFTGWTALIAIIIRENY